TGRSPPGPRPVAAPEPALATRAPAFPGHVLPRIGPDGRTPMAVYASAFDRADPRPRVGLILAGVGLNRAASLAAIRALPAGITLAVSPYATGLAPVLAAARATGHEYLLSIPMEPQSFPLNDPGNHALLTRLTSAQNRHQLDWVLSRFAGYVGATGALGALAGERFAGSAEDMDPVLARLAQSGLLYVDPRPGARRLPSAWGSDVDVVIDAPGSAAAIDAALDRLDRIAHRRGHALGLVGAVRPVAVAHVAAWANGLAAHGLVLAPVTALALPPPKPAPAGPAQP
ncbi:MAG: divergent polysaccharide deacetylase family protein, partial [Acetobacteraceae bacterium]